MTMRKVYLGEETPIAADSEGVIWRQKSRFSEDSETGENRNRTGRIFTRKDGFKAGTLEADGQEEIHFIHQVRGGINIHFKDGGKPLAYADQLKMLDQGKIESIRYAKGEITIYFKSGGKPVSSDRVEITRMLDEEYPLQSAA